MLMSSMMGAIAFQKDLGAVHSCAHALSTVADMHHGLANGIMIDHVMRFNLPAADREDGGARARGARAGRRRGQRGSARRAFIEWLDAAQGALGIPAKLSRYCVPRRPGGHCARWSSRHRRHLPPDQSASVHAADFEKLFAAAF